MLQANARLYYYFLSYILNLANRNVYKIYQMLYILWVWHLRLKRFLLKFLTVWLDLEKTKRRELFKDLLHMHLGPWNHKFKSCYCWALEHVDHVLYSIPFAVFSLQYEKCENGSHPSWVHLNTACTWASSLTFHEERLYAFVKYVMKCLSKAVCLKINILKFVKMSHFQNCS